MARVFFIPLYTLILMGKIFWNECHLSIKANPHQSSLFYNTTLLQSGQLFFLAFLSTHFIVPPAKDTLLFFVIH